MNKFDAYAIMAVHTNSSIICAIVAVREKLLCEDMHFGSTVNNVHIYALIVVWV